MALAPEIASIGGCCRRLGDVDVAKRHGGNTSLLCVFSLLHLLDTVD